MTAREIKAGVHSVGAIDWDRRLFDELIPLPDGTTYNSYLVVGREKTALIDSVDPTKWEELAANLKEAGVKELDYIVSNHAEQDHSGSIPRLLQTYPKAKVVTNQKCKEYLKDLLGIPEGRFTVVADGERLKLGGKTLQFILAPWVHWPETMLTYLQEDGILFSCDLFGSHLASSELYALDEAKVLMSAKRYYAEIMMPFRVMVRSHLQKLSGYEFGIIAPSHGPIYDSPSLIMDAYADWTSDSVKNEVVIAYVSMHGSTSRLVERLAQALKAQGIQVRQFNLSKMDLGELAMALVDCATVVIATPTVLAGPHPLAAYAAYLANALRPKTRYAGVIGSYGWGGKTVEQITGMLGNLKVEVLNPILVKGIPKEEDLGMMDHMAQEIALRHSKL
jgi:flavorubredoxin